MYKLKLPVVSEKPQCLVEIVIIKEKPDHFTAKSLEADAKKWARFLDANCPARFVDALKKNLE